VKSRGFRSAAHYLIETRQAGPAKGEVGQGEIAKPELTADAEAPLSPPRVRILRERSIASYFPATFGAAVAPAKPAQEFVGAVMRKRFDGKFFYGTVVKIDPRSQLYWVNFDDNDSEEFTAAELKPLVVSADKHAAAREEARKTLVMLRPSKRARR
jgi:hypothetical protein